MKPNPDNNLDAIVIFGVVFPFALAFLAVVISIIIHLL